MDLSSFATLQINSCTRSVEIFSVCVCVCICVSVFVFVCVSKYKCVLKGLKEELKFVIFFSKNLNVNEIDAILKTHKYKQYKKNSFVSELDTYVIYKRVLGKKTWITNLVIVYHNCVTSVSQMKLKT